MKEVTYQYYTFEELTDIQKEECLRVHRYRYAENDLSYIKDHWEEQMVEEYGVRVDEVYSDSFRATIVDAIPLIKLFSLQTDAESLEGLQFNSNSCNLGLDSAEEVEKLLTFFRSEWGYWVRGMEEERENLVSDDNLIEEFNSGELLFCPALNYQLINE